MGRPFAGKRWIELLCVSTASLLSCGVAVAATAQSTITLTPATAITVGTTGPFGACSTKPPAASPQWLKLINSYRKASGLCPVDNNRREDAGLLAHFTYLQKTPASEMTGRYASEHTENPASPYYTTAGAQQAAASDLLPGGAGSAIHAIDGWLSAPFHAIGMLRLDLTQVAFASDPEGYAGLNVISGLTGSARQTRPIVFPGPGMATDLTTFGGEVPNPLETCGWQNATGQAGLPLIALLARTPATSVTAAIKGPDGTMSTKTGSLCLVDQFTYHSSDRVYGATGRALLKHDHAIFLIPRGPLATGKYSVDIQQPGQAAIKWSFSVRAR